MLVSIGAEFRGWVLLVRTGKCIYNQFHFLLIRVLASPNRLLSTHQIGITRKASVGLFVLHLSV